VEQILLFERNASESAKGRSMTAFHVRRTRPNSVTAFSKFSARNSPLDKAVKLYLSLADRIGAKPYGSNNNLVSISNHVPNINCEVWDLIHQHLKPLCAFVEIIFVVAFELMVVKVRSHIPKNGLNIPTVHRLEVTLYELSVYACLLHSFLLSIRPEFQS
jgi:hypothetical protein